MQSSIDLPLHLEPNEVAPQDAGIIERLLAAYRRAKANEPADPDSAPKESVWGAIAATHHREAHELLDRGDVDALAAYMANALRTPLCTGVGGPVIFRMLRDGGDDRALILAQMEQRMRGAAVGIGALFLEHPEHQVHGKHPPLAFSAVVNRIEAIAGTQLSRPAVMGIAGLSAGPNKVIDFKAAEDVCCAARMPMLLDPGGVIAELGGGFGGTALQLVRVGFNVLMFDLPIMCVAQGFFLIKALGAEKVALYGEAHHGWPVRVLPWWAFHDRSISFDLVFNRDSMTEFPEAVALRYLQEIKSRAVPFLSINHETRAPFGQHGTPHLAVGPLATGIGLKRRQRSAYWARPGYIEELFVPG